MPNTHLIILLRFFAAIGLCQCLFQHQGNDALVKLEMDRIENAEEVCYSSEWFVRPHHIFEYLTMA